MQLKDQHIDEFITLYKKRYEVTLEPSEALEVGLRLVKLVELVSLVPNKNEHEDERMDKIS